MKRLLTLALCLLAVGCGGKTLNPDPGSSVTGIASWYAHKFHGRQTANGEIYDETLLTAAHRTLPFGTWVRVTRLDTGRAVTLRINDRGPFVDGRIIDVSYKAAQDLDFVRLGLVEVRVEVLESP